MKYCKKCLTTSLRPNALFNTDGVCIPCEYSSSINKESQLRNQFFALQKCEQPNYVPSTTSDMYQVQVTGRPEAQPFPGLFVESELAPFNPNVCNLGGNIFDNCTRQQLKNV